MRSPVDIHDEGGAVTTARVVSLGALAIVAIVVLWMLFFRQTGHEYTLLFQNAGQLVKGNEVRIAGRPIGKVTGIGLTEDNRAKISVIVEEPYAPLTRGTTAAIRAGSLSGQANRYIALSLGPDNAEPYPDGATLGTDKTTTAVDLDELFATLDKDTREGLQKVIIGSSKQYGDDGETANAALKQFRPFVSSFTNLSAEINRDQQAFADAIVNAAKVSAALAERRDDLSGLVTNTATAMGAIADSSDGLDQALAALPSTLRGGNTTLVSLRAALDDLDQLTAATKPLTPRLERLFRELRPLVRDAQPTIRNLRLIVNRPGANNDLTEILRA